MSKPSMIDEARKMVYVSAIIDATHFQGAWRGQMYEARAIPSCDFAVGDTVFCHVLPGTTELVAIRPGEELWFSPGAPYPYGSSDLWVLYQGSGTPTYVWTCPHDWELITHICWCQADNNLYVFTWQDWAQPVPQYGMRVYRVNRAAKTVAEVVSYLTPGAGDDYTDPVVDTAEFNNKLYCMTGGYMNWGNVWLFDPIAETLILEFHIPDVDGYGFGIACNAAGTEIYASDGCNVYKYTLIGGWVYDERITPPVHPGWGWDQMSILTEPENDLTHLALQPGNYEAPPRYILGQRDNATGIYTGLFTGRDPGSDDPQNQSGNIVLANLFDKATGVLEASYSGGWGWFPNDAGGKVYRRPPGGAWAIDGQLPFIWNPGVETMREMFLTTQGFAQFGVHLYMLSWHFHYKWVGGAWVAEPDNYRCRLWRRMGMGIYAMVWESAGQRDFLPTHAYCSGMCKAPNATRKTHEYN